LKKETAVVRGYRCIDEKTGAISFPIYQSATFRHPGLNESTGYDYSRTQNPTREELEKTIAKLECGSEGLAFSTGMAAISAIISIFKPGDSIVVSDDLYGGTYRIFEEIYGPYGIKAIYVDTQDLANIDAAVDGSTKAIFLETPSNPIMKVSDIKAVSEYAKSRGIITIVDNTFLTPYYQQPIKLGADIVVHSATKYLGGHNDTLAGLVVTSTEEYGEKLRFVQNSVGAVLSPFDSWLILRGIKTLGVRLDRQEQNAIQIAKWLKSHEKIEKVYYVGLEDHPGHELTKSQTSGFGSMISFAVKDASLVEQILGRLKLIFFAESLGGVESLMTYPLTQTHADIPEEIRDRLGVNDKLLRLSVGIESYEDLIEDLEQSLK
jgi:cystathionine gamma-synthase